MFTGLTVRNFRSIEDCNVEIGPVIVLFGPTSAGKSTGHGRNGAAAYKGAHRVSVPHAPLKAGDLCPAGCGGKVYPQHEPGVPVRIGGQAPIAATVYELEKLRCNLCGDLSGNVPKLPEPGPEGGPTVLANGNAHGRRRFGKVIANFPDECRFVLEARPPAQPCRKLTVDRSGAISRGVDRRPFHR